MRQPNPVKIGACFLAAGVLFALFAGLLGGGADNSRSTWPILIGLLFGVCAAVGGFIGALFDWMWIGVLVGALVPFLLVYLYGIPC